MYPSLVFTVAMKEFKNSLRNRWIIAVAAIFAILAISISYFGFASRGEVGFGGFEITIVSLASLVTYLVPIIALTLGFDTVVGESEGRTLELLLTMPVSRLELFLGKYVGLSAALAISIIAGFGMAGLLIGWKTGTEHLGNYVFFILSSVLLGISFLSLAMMVSAMVAERAKAIGWVVFIWFFFVLLFDMAMIGILVITEGKITPSMFSALLYANPADIFRLINLVSFEAVKGTYGLATLAEGPLFGPSVLYLGALAWVLLPLGGGYFFFMKRSG